MKSSIVTGAVFLALIMAFAWTAGHGRLPWEGPPVHGTDWCEAHQVELSKCEVCNPKLARGGTVVTRMREPKEGECPNTLVKIELGPGAAERAGVRTAAVESRPIAETARGNAEVEYVPASWARVGPRLGGVVRSVAAALGQQVEAGTPLAVVESSALSEAKSAYLQAVATRELRQELYTKTKDLFDKRLIAGKDELEARTVQANRAGRPFQRSTGTNQFRHGAVIARRAVVWPWTPSAAREATQRLRRRVARVLAGTVRR